MADLHHCPRCELRFVNTSELRQHFAADHGGDGATFERFRYRAGPSARAPDVHTVLLVGNETLDREGVLDVAIARAGHGGRVVVVVPAAGAGAADAGIARWRLTGALDRLRAAGADCDGLVGDADPYAAVTRVLGREHVDEIVVSTLSEATSRWLGVDLPGRLRRHTRRPVHVLTPVAVPD